MKKYYVLPCSPTVKCEDRFSLLDGDDLEVPFWSLLQVLLKEPASSTRQIIDTLDTIAVTLRQSSLEDFGRLRGALDRCAGFLNIWPWLVRIALSLPDLFPDHRLPILGDEDTSLTLSRTQVCCLAVHQFLCTLQAPSWQDGYQDFDMWYATSQPHNTAADIYLDSVLEYFTRCAKVPSLLEETEWTITYEMHSAQRMKAGLDKLIPLEVVQVPQVSACEDLLGLGPNACVVSANKYVGFGQSATQEEIFVGTCPEACPVVLVTPPLRDDQVLTVRGAEAMVETVGQRRDFKSVGNYNADSRTAQETQRWRTRTMLFMDALELDLDESDSLPDLVPANVRRERVKAQTAFASGSYESVSVGFWGCGAFNGDPHVKMLLLWSAASAAGTRLRVVCEAGQRGFGEQLEAVAAAVLARSDAIAVVDEALEAASAAQLGRGETLGFLQARMASL